VKTDAQSKKLEKCVNDFLKESRLTEENLKKLDSKIVAVLALGDDQRSVKSAASQRSNKDPTTHLKGDFKDNASDAGSEVSLKSVHSIYKEEEDHDEWFLISKFNTQLYVQEQNERKKRIYDQKNYVKIELDKQLSEKKKLQEQEKKQEELYHKALMEQLDRSNMIESAKHDSVVAKISAEKIERSSQIQRDELKRKKEVEEETVSDKKSVTKLLDEIEHEKDIEKQRKVQDKVYQEKLLEENKEKLQIKHKEKLKLMTEEQKIIEE
jgi:hypothetical protein